MAFFSVIIPVYKVEKYLSECVDSVINQKLNNIEIILVDDGSPDACPQICDEYQEKYDYVKVIHKPNGGLSSARNAGIEAATGDYLIFMDSDDWWNPDVDVNAMLAKVCEHPDVEMFLFSSLDYIEGEGYYRRSEHDRLSAVRTDTVEHYYQDLLCNGNLEIHAATKILKRDFLIQNSLTFKEGIVSEDNEWILRVLRSLNSVVIINQPLYIYRANRQGSITNNISIKNIKDLLYIVKESLDFYDRNPEGKYKNNELCYVSYLWFSALGLSTQLPKKEQKQIMEVFQKTSSVCRYSNSKKTKICNVIYSLTGYKTTAFILGIYIRLKRRLRLNKRKV